MYKTLAAAACLLVAAMTMGAPPAQNPHFISGPTITDNGTTLSASGSIAGLGNNESITIELNATATVTTTCTNPGGNVAPGQTKTVDLTASGDFTSDKNGRVNFSLTTQEPTPGRCPNGKWTGDVVNVQFTDVTLLVDGRQVYP